MSDSDAKNPEVDFSEFHLLHDVFRHRAADPVQEPLLAFPKKAHADYELFTGKVLNRFTDKAAWHYSTANLQTLAGLRSIALLGPTSLDWVVSVFGLSRAGYTILTLSPRLSAPAIVKLMQETRCQCVLYHHSPQLDGVVEEAATLMTLQSLPLYSRAEYDTSDDAVAPFERDVDVAEEKKRTATIVHSSGSTGLPKPIEIVHGRFTMAYAIGPGDRDLVTLPFFALQVCPGRMYQRKTVYFLNPDLPLTCQGLTDAIRAARPGTMCAVPYVLKLLAEEESGINALKEIGQVMFTGSPCPDDLGDQLVEKGVNLASFMGTSECGLVGASIGRPADDKAWNYLRVPPPLMKHIYPKPIAPDTFEFIYLKDHPGRLVSNSDDPSGSFHSRDIFSPHQTISGAWKYLGRLDDRITLMNGEKVLPLPIEGSIRRHHLVREAVMFGIGRTIPGLLLFKSQVANDLQDEDIIDSLWPTILAANRTAEGFSQIGRDMIVVLSNDAAVPMTEKGSIIRAQVYTAFAKEIEDAYTRNAQRQEGSLVLDGAELEQHLLQLGREIVGPQLLHHEDDLFTMGMNSLQAIQMRGSIIRDLDLAGNAARMSQNCVFENGNIANLARYLEGVRSSHNAIREKPIAMMQDLVSRFSAFQKHVPGTHAATNMHTVVLSGATGGLGAHILSLLLTQPNVTTVYCLIRGADPLERLQKTFQKRRLAIPSSEKFQLLTSDLDKAQLGLSNADYQALKSATHIVHCAWPVNFQLGLPSFIPSLQGLQNLIQLSLSSSLLAPPKFIFCSSISAALGTTGPAVIPEAQIESLDQVSHTGYAASKFAGERIIEAAIKDHGADATILRIGQVVGDTKAGVWNDTEAFPLIITSALTMSTLPELSLACQWLPVDTAAEALVDIMRLDSEESETDSKRQLFYNLVSPHTFFWTRDLLPALRKTSLSKFDTIPFDQWLTQLRKLSTTDSENASEKTNNASNPKLNPALKLVDFFAQDFAGKGPTSEVNFAIDKTLQASPALQKAPEIIKSGLLKKMVGVWLAEWANKASIVA